MELLLDLVFVLGILTITVSTALFVVYMAAENVIGQRITGSILGVGLMSIATKPIAFGYMLTESIALGFGALIFFLGFLMVYIANFSIFETKER